jgi:undecaprenyl diphosphate synthase
MNNIRNILLQGLFFLIIIIPAFWFVYFIKRLYVYEYHMNKNNIIFHVNHLGVIMDGNRRWAKNKNTSLYKAYEEGAKKLLELIEICLQENVPYVTVYALALSNLQKRSSSEINIIFDVAFNVLTSQEQWIIEQGIKINIVGNTDFFSEEIKKRIREINNTTKNGKNLTLNILFGYDPIDDMLYSVKTMIKEIEEKKISLDEIDEKKLFSSLRSAEIPPVDLIIRTGSCERLSGFLPLQSTYSEIVILSDLWPNVCIDTIKQLIMSFHIRTRNFGQ